MTDTSIAENSTNEIKKNLSVSLPLITAQLIYASSGFLGTVFVAKLGQEALAASILVSTIWLSLSVLFFGLLNSICVLISHQYGANNKTMISEIMGQSFLLGLILSIIIMGLLFMMPWFFQHTTQPPEVIRLAIDYTYSLIWTIPSLVLLIIYEEFLAGINLTKTVLRISLVIVPLEIPIIYALIFGKFGLPQCGVAGIGYGFAITYTLTALYLTIYLLRSAYFREFAIFKNITTLHKLHLKNLVFIGLPIGFMHTIELSTFAIITFWIARFGTTLLAAHQIMFQFLGFMATFVFAMAQAVTIRVGHEVGQLKKQSIYYAAYIGLLLTTIAMLIIALAFYLIPDFFLSIDINVHTPSNRMLVKKASHLLSICGVFMLVDSIRIIGFGALRGLKDTKYPMYITIVSYWIVGLLSAYILGFYLHLEAAGIWWGLVIGNLFGALAIFYRLRYMLQKSDIQKILGRKHSARVI